MESLSEAPKSSSFVPLAEHQSTTPESFYNGPPVLHYYSDRCKLIVLDDDLEHAPVIAALIRKAASRGVSDTTSEPQTNGDGSAHKTVEDVDIWVTSDKFLFYSNGLDTGFSISYPSISLHAIQSLPEPSATDNTSQGLYMQLITSTPSSSNDEEPDSISITIIPTAPGVPVTTNQTDPATADPDAEIKTEDIPETTPVQALFKALSDCSNLHPDPIDPDDQDTMMQFEGDAQGIQGSRLFQAGLLQPGASGEGLPPPMPGSGGWITAENMHEYFDEEGNWIGPEDGDNEMDEAQEPADGNDSLGAGAGTVRAREDDDGAVNGDGDESKWRRTG